MWADADQSVEFSSRQRSNGQNGNKKDPASYPQRVSPHLLNRKATNERANTKRILFSYSGPTFSELDEGSNESCSEYEPDIEVKKKSTSVLTTTMFTIYCLTCLIYLCNLYKYFLFIFICLVGSRCWICNVTEKPRPRPEAGPNISRIHKVTLSL